MSLSRYTLAALFVTAGMTPIQAASHHAKINHAFKMHDAYGGSSRFGQSALRPNGQRGRGTRSGGPAGGASN